MFCEVDIGSLAERHQLIPKMLLPISGSNRVWSSSVSQGNEIMIGVHSGRKPDADVRDWRFTTPVLHIRGSYFERWIPGDEKRINYYLDRAYLHLYWRQDAADEETELLALHCDPNEPDDTGILKQATYKRGPHIHVSASEQPLPHSHFALNMGHLPEVLGSIESLSSAVGSGVTLLRDQVLDVIDHRRLKKSYLSLK